MLYFALICLCLTLLGVAGFQLAYMAYLDRMDKERKKRVVELEHKCLELSAKLVSAQAKVDEQEKLIERLDPFNERQEEVWADFIDES